MGQASDLTSKAKKWHGALPDGTRLHNFTISSVLGQGGFGTTYLATDDDLGRRVAIKEYLPDGLAIRKGESLVLPRSTECIEDFQKGRDDFLKEAQILARLEGIPGIVRVYTFLEANGTAYMVMALAAGKTLKDIIREREEVVGEAPLLAFEELRPMFFTLLDGLAAVHKEGFLHRDIKPANIIVDSAWNPTLIDFGASRAVLSQRTVTNIYTHGYGAPEQMSSGKQGPWTDIYGLAATVFAAIIGRPPPNVLDRLADGVDTYRPLADMELPDFPPEFLRAVDAGLILRAGERPQSIGAWRQRILARPTEVDDSTIIDRKPSKRHDPAAAPTVEPRVSTSERSWQRDRAGEPLQDESRGRSGSRSRQPQRDPWDRDSVPPSWPAKDSSGSSVRGREDRSAASREIGRGAPPEVDEPTLEAPRQRSARSESARQQVPPDARPGPAEGEPSAGGRQGPSPPRIQPSSEFHDLSLQRFLEEEKKAAAQAAPPVPHAVNVPPAQPRVFRLALVAGSVAALALLAGGGVYLLTSNNRSSPSISQAPKVEDAERAAQEARKAMAEVEKLAAEAKRQADAVEARHQADREKADREKADREKADREKADREKADREKADREKADREKADREKADREKADREKADREKADREKADREKADREKADREKADREKADREKADREKADREKADREKADREKADREKADREKADREKADREKADREKADREKADREKADREKADREKADREKADREKADREKADREKADREKADREKADREKADRQKADREKADREKADREKADREKADREKADREKADREKADREKADREKAEADTNPKEAEAAQNALNLTQLDRKRIQVALGFDSQSVDGILGRNSQERIRNWQKARGDLPTGFLTGPQHKELLAKADAAIRQFDAEERKREERRRFNPSPPQPTPEPQAPPQITQPPPPPPPPPPLQSATPQPSAPHRGRAGPMTPF